MLALLPIVAGKILKIPVALSSHGIRHNTLKSNLSGLFGNLLLGMEYRLDFFNLKKADTLIVVNQSIKEYFEQRVSRDIRFIPIPIQQSDYGFSGAQPESSSERARNK